jgi:phage-related protein
VPIIPPASPTGVLRYEWIDPGGTTRDLSQATSPRLFVGRGSVGLGSATAEIGSDKVPGDPGALVRHLSTPARRIELPIVVNEDSIGDLLTVVDALRTWFDTGNERRLTPGTLRITRPDDTVRQIQAYYAGGLEGDTRDGAPSFAQYVVSLFCPDPFPTEDADTEHTYDQSDVGVQQIIINQGDLEAYPIWRINGPASAITITQDVPASGESFALTENGGVTLTAGQWVEIDARPSHTRTNLSVLDQAGLSRYDRVLPTSSFFQLDPGENRFTISLSGATGDTSIELRYLARYRGLLR